MAQNKNRYCKVMIIIITLREWGPGKWGRGGWGGRGGEGDAKQILTD